MLNKLLISPWSLPTTAVTDSFINITEYVFANAVHNYKKKVLGQSPDERERFTDGKGPKRTGAYLKHLLGDQLGGR
jgi:hypothetical protein